MWHKVTASRLRKRCRASEVARQLRSSRGDVRYNNEAFVRDALCIDNGGVGVDDADAEHCQKGGHTVSDVEFGKIA